MPENPVIQMPQMCNKHQSLLVQQLGLTQADPWRAHIIVAQIVLFQATTAHPSTWEKVDGKVERIPELGCLACFRPDSFGEIIEAMRTGGISAAKALGERYAKEGGGEIT